MNRRVEMKLLLEIFATFFKIGAFTFGGGYAMIPLIEHEVIEKKEWIKDKDEIVNVFAVAESIPGAIAINSSTLVGYKLAGAKGAIIAACGVILPSFIIITMIAAFFSKFQDNSIVKAAFLGVRSAVVALIFIAALKVGKRAIKDRWSACISIATVLLMLIFNIHAIFIIIAGILIGLIIYFLLPQKASKILKESGDRD